MGIIILVEEFFPFESDLIDNWYEKRINQLGRKKNSFKTVRNFDEVESGQKYLDTEGKIRTKK